jgi:hypothetical protein
MDEIRLEKVRRVVLERLTLGERREALTDDLRKRLDRETAQEMIDAAVREIAASRASGEFDISARLLRKRIFSAEYVAWSLLSWVLIIGATLYSLLTTLVYASLAISFGPIALGIIILAIVEWRVNAKSLAADKAVDDLLRNDVTLSATR